MFGISFSTRAKKEFDEMEGKQKERIAEILRTLSFDPVPVKMLDVKKLAGLSDTFRIRIGKIEWCT
jgi:mRNA-degrading endonuclease RelE of RelBE toxin-antitoxin system